MVKDQEVARRGEGERDGAGVDRLIRRSAESKEGIIMILRIRTPYKHRPPPNLLPPDWGIPGYLIGHYSVQYCIACGHAMKP